MDNDQFHNANIIRNKLSLKNNEISQDQLERKIFQYEIEKLKLEKEIMRCLLYTSPSPRDGLLSRMPSSA